MSHLSKDHFHSLSVWTVSLEAMPIKQIFLLSMPQLNGTHHYWFSFYMSFTCWAAYKEHNIYCFPHRSVLTLIKYIQINVTLHLRVTVHKIWENWCGIIPDLAFCGILRKLFFFPYKWMDFPQLFDSSKSSSRIWFLVLRCSFIKINMRKGSVLCCSEKPS